LLLLFGMSSYNKELDVYLIAPVLSCFRCRYYLPWVMFGLVGRPDSREVLDLEMNQSPILPLTPCIMRALLAEMSSGSTLEAPGTKSCHCSRSEHLKVPSYLGSDLHNTMPNPSDHPLYLTSIQAREITQQFEKVVLRPGCRVLWSGVPRTWVQN
jgi:hypothetical protein